MPSRTNISEVIDSGLVAKFKRDLVKVLDSVQQTSNQIWKPVSNFENLYEVSNFARIRSLDRTIQKFGKLCVRKGKILVPCIYKDFKVVRLVDEDSNKHFKYLHRLVYEAFKGEIQNGAQIIHKDRNKNNNCPDNLEQVFEKHVFNLPRRERTIYKCKETGETFKNPSKFMKKRNLKISLYIFKNCVRTGEVLPGTKYHIGIV